MVGFDSSRRDVIGCPPHVGGAEVVEVVTPGGSEVDAALSRVGAASTGLSFAQITSDLRRMQTRGVNTGFFAVVLKDAEARQARLQPRASVAPTAARPAASSLTSARLGPAPAVTRRAGSAPGKSSSSRVGYDAEGGDLDSVFDEAPQMVDEVFGCPPIPRV
jgi:hypothetical protein